jgi:hypothetical protein
VVFIVAVTAGAMVARIVPTPSTDSAKAAACSGSASRQYVWSRSSLAAYGVDGYLRHPSGSLVDPDCSFLAHFFAVADPGSPVGAWVQVGLTVGVLPNPPGGVPTTYKIYSDGVNNCGTYNLVNHGNPTASNRAYYLSYTGTTGTSCNTTFYQYAIRKDDWYNQPI